MVLSPERKEALIAYCKEQGSETVRDLLGKGVFNQAKRAVVAEWLEENPKAKPVAPPKPPAPPAPKPTQEQLAEASKKAEGKKKDA